MFSKRLTKAALLASTGLLAITAAGAARADDAVAAAKAYIEKVTAPVTNWDGPTTGPKAVGHKLIVYVSTDQRNGGARGVGEGIEEAAKVIGWEVRAIDGQGSVNARAAGIAQAIALKADGLVLDAIDAAEQAAAIEQAEKAGIKVVGWHSAAVPGPIAKYGLFTNVTTDPMQVAKAAGSYAVAASDGKAGAIVFTDSAYAIAIAKSNEMAAVIRACTTCTVLSVEDTPLADAANRMPQLTTSLLQR